MKEQPTNSKNNAELCAKDMSAATRQEKIDWLMQIIDNELDRGEEMRDEELIWECMETLEQLSEQPTAAIPSPAQKAERKSFRAPRSKRVKKVILRISAIAAVLAMAISLPIYAHAQTLVRQDKQMLNDAMSYAKAMEKLEADPSETTDPSSPVKPSENTDPSTTAAPQENTAPTTSTPTPVSPASAGVRQKTFSRMTDLFWEYPTLDFYYPRQNSQMPDHMRTDLKQVSITYDSDESWVAVLSFDHPSLKSFVVQKQVSAAKYTPPSKEYTVIKAQYRSYGIYKVETEEGTLYETGFTFSGLSYTVQALDIESIRLALNSIWDVREYCYSVEELEDNWKHLWGFRLPERIPKGYTLTRIEVRHENNANWYIRFQYTSPEGYSATCGVSRSHNNPVEEFRQGNNNPNIQWIPTRMIQIEWVN